MVDPKCNLVTQWYQSSGSVFCNPLNPSLNFQDGSHNWKHYGYTLVIPMIRKKMTVFWQELLLIREENSSQNPFLCITLVSTGLLSIPRLIKGKEEWEPYDWPNSKHVDSILFGEFWKCLFGLRQLSGHSTTAQFPHEKLHRRRNWYMKKQWEIIA